ncbi:hypothetical protein GGR74_003364 [Xanthomonas arboricola]
MLAHACAVVVVFQFFGHVVVIEWLQTDPMTPEQQRTVTDAHFLRGTSMQQHLAVAQCELVAFTLLIDGEPAERRSAVTAARSFDRGEDGQRHLLGQIRRGQERPGKHDDGQHRLPGRWIRWPSRRIVQPGTAAELAQAAVFVGNDDLVESGAGARLHVYARCAVAR